MNRNRIVTGHDAAGNAKVMLSGPVPGDSEFEHSPGFAAAVVWQTVPIPSIEPRAADAGASFTSVMPACGGTTAMVVTFPPDSVSASPGFDPQKAGAEFAARLPGLADSFEADGSGYHRTESIDYGVVIEGEIWLDLGDGEGGCLRQGDVVVQVGTRHAWRNRSDRPARLFFVLIGAAK
ncbi:MAG: cupin domain-containing protein [Betaproteobacteria bacterium HGW-Betaproteobacteria-19]|nr:MAG: cupin domain-containing protein [Betaproteobacteria bacterium HGW-Betaproteobacteria-19]